jgi:hypothetical protein
MTGYGVGKGKISACQIDVWWGILSQECNVKGLICYVGLID